MFKDKILCFIEIYVLNLAIETTWLTIKEYFLSSVILLQSFSQKTNFVSFYNCAVWRTISCKDSSAIYFSLNAKAQVDDVRWLTKIWDEPRIDIFLKNI